jgi:hypothetical protein
MKQVSLGLLLIGALSSAASAQAQAQLSTGGARVTKPVVAHPTPKPAAPAPTTAKPAATTTASPAAAKTANAAANSKAEATPPSPLKPLNSATAPTAKPAVDTAPKALINREVFAYEGSGRRDPFVSLLTTSDLKPLLQDLKLVGVAYDPRGQNSVAVLRDVTSKYDQYRVRVGQTIGRMRVAAIQPKAVIFTIEEFGYSRQELLPIAPPDSTKMRQRQ